MSCSVILLWQLIILMQNMCNKSSIHSITRNLLRPNNSSSVPQVRILSPRGIPLTDIELQMVRVLLLNLTYFALRIILLLSDFGIM